MPAHFQFMSRQICQSFLIRFPKPLFRYLICIQLKICPQPVCNNFPCFRVNHILIRNICELRGYNPENVQRIHTEHLTLFFQRCFYLFTDISYVLAFCRIHAHFNRNRRQLFLSHGIHCSNSCLLCGCLCSGIRFRLFCLCRLFCFFLRSCFLSRFLDDLNKAQFSVNLQDSAVLERFRNSNDRIGEHTDFSNPDNLIGCVFNFHSNSPFSFLRCRLRSVQTAGNTLRYQQPFPHRE
nr:MAG TPA: hypothetical protein [Caudoviricetes sp.]DAP27659.1 MAG TPA: hypothetical protein [Caudoviricetes sp.]